MKNAIILSLLLISSTLLADAKANWGDPSVYCDIIDLRNAGAPFSITLYKEGAIDDQHKFVASFNEYNPTEGKIVENSDATFNILILKSSLFYEEIKTNFLFPSLKEKIKTYALQMNISSNKDIGHITQGLLVKRVKEIEKNIFCYEMTKWDRR